MTKVNIDTVLGKIGDKYDITDHVDGLQNDPNYMTSTDFKQEYTVIIRKKKYYAITALEGNDAYQKMYQIDNFVSVNTSSSVSGNPGSCRVSLAGGTRITCATREEQDSEWGNGEKGFFNMLSGWSKNIDDGNTKINNDGNYIYNNMLFDNIDDMKEMKYGWTIAEKCDFEPMDEIYVYGKSKREKDGDKYKVYQLFFGYISDVTKSYTAGKSYPLIQISATDHLKLLQISYISDKPALWYNIAAAGAHYDTDFAGNIIIDDNPLSTGDSPELKALPFTNVFAGRYPYEIIADCANNAGIPKKFLTKRIEKVKRIPFMPQFKSGQWTEPFQNDLHDALSYCTKAASTLFMEFFADEEGNLVLKIPNYTLGANKLPANNAYIDRLMTDEEKEIVKKFGTTEKVTETVTTYETVTETISDSITHTVETGDTLWNLAETYLGDSSKWNEIYDINKNVVKNPNWLCPGTIITIKPKVTQSKQIANKQQITSDKQSTGKLSKVTDKYIPIIFDRDLISFVLQDSDAQVANSFEIHQDAGFFGQQTDGANGNMVFKRVVQDWNSIVRFGIRDVKTISTPLLDNEVGAVMFGTLMVERSLAQRYKGSLKMIEESSIRVGNPVRLFMYDEHPYKFNTDQSSNGPHQAIFYVESISRDLTPDGVSTMSLSLSAGRVMGMESIYDKMQVLYKKFYDEAKIETWDPNKANVSTNSATNSSNNIMLSGNMTDKQRQILEYAKQFLGIKYEYGGKGPKTFDCSGLVAYVFNHFGYNLTPQTNSMEKEIKTVSVDDIQPADVVFFNNFEHEGIYMGNGQYIHAPHTGDVVKISKLSDRTDLCGVRRVL